MLKPWFSDHFFLYSCSSSSSCFILLWHGCYLLFVIWFTLKSVLLLASHHSQTSPPRSHLYIFLPSSRTRDEIKFMINHCSVKGRMRPNENEWAAKWKKKRERQNERRKSLKCCVYAIHKCVRVCVFCSNAFLSLKCENKSV